MKERFKPMLRYCLKDYETNNLIFCYNRVTICNLLNEQDKKIKKLEEEIKGLQQLNEILINENKRLKTQMTMIKTHQMIEELELIKTNLNKLNPQLYISTEYKEEVIRQIDFEIKKFKDIGRTQSGLKRI